MAARSFALDLVQMTAGEFRQQYNWNNLVDTEFYRLRSSALQGAHSRILHAEVDTTDSIDLSGLLTVVITSLYISVAGTNGSTEILITTSAGNHTYFLSTIAADLAPSTLSLTGLEMPITGIAFQTALGGALTASVYILGYTPPTTNP